MQPFVINHTLYKCIKNKNINMEENEMILFIILGIMTLIGIVGFSMVRVAFGFLRSFLGIATILGIIMIVCIAL